MNKHIQGIAIYKPKKSPKVEVVVIAHSEDGFSTILMQNGEQRRVRTSSLTMKEA